MGLYPELYGRAVAKGCSPGVSPRAVAQSLAQGLFPTAVVPRAALQGCPQGLSPRAFPKGCPLLLYQQLYKNQMCLLQAERKANKAHEVPAQEQVTHTTCNCCTTYNLLNSQVTAERLLGMLQHQTTGRK